MEIQEKHRLEILNAKCNYVCAVDILQKKMSYGEDVSCCINKLYLASRLINRLECFCFETPVTVEVSINSKFTFPVEHLNYVDGDILTLIANGVQIGSKTSVGAEYRPTFWVNFLESLDIPTTTEVVGSNTIFVSTFGCNITKLEVIRYSNGSLVGVSVTTNTVIGACATSNPPCYNCIKVSDLPKMYEVLAKLLS